MCGYYCLSILNRADDAALFSNSKRELYAWKRAIIERLGRMRLRIHEHAAQVQPVNTGIPWLGYVVYPTHRLLKRRNAIAFTKRLSRNLSLFRAGAISFAELDASVQGWIAHVNFGDTWGLRRHIFAEHSVPHNSNQK